ncbi:MAG: response regulator [Bdellovibrionales bacterium]|nr:response regulator [Bdellovibrionales bacterium]
MISFEKCVLAESKPSPSLEQRVLLVDDSPDLLFLEQSILEMGGFRVSTAQSGTEALSILSQMKTPDIILIDFYLGDMTGQDFLDILRNCMPELAKTVPIIFLTGSDQIPTCKAAGIIRKPSGIYDLVESVQGYLKAVSI